MVFGKKNRSQSDKRKPVWDSINKSPGRGEKEEV